jgi:hypothetical protein
MEKFLRFALAIEWLLGLALTVALFVRGNFAEGIICTLCFVVGALTVFDDHQQAWMGGLLLFVTFPLALCLGWPWW